VATPLGNLHGEYHAQAILLFGLYTARTPGVKIADNATLILGEEDEVQPDISMRMVPECGGKASLSKDGYLQGAPELVGFHRSVIARVRSHGWLDERVRS